MDGRWNPERPDMPDRVTKAAGRFALRTRSARVVAAAVGAVAVVLAVAIVLAATRSSTSDGAAVDPPGGSAAPSASHAAPPASSAPPATPAAEPELPSRPTEFGAWWAKAGTYGAKWEAPESDGNTPITGYVVKDCDGTELGRVGPDVFQTEVAAKNLSCMTVQAVNEVGEGETAQFDGLKAGG